MRIDLNSSIQLKNPVSTQEKTLTPGDIIRGKILELSNGSAIIKTSSGQLINATISNLVQIHTGEFVELLINNVSDGKIYAEVNKKDNTNQANQTNLNEKLYTLLNEIDIPVKVETINLAKLLLKYDMPINKETMNHVINIQNSILNLTNVSTEKLLSLLALNSNIQDTPVDILNKTVMSMEADIRNIVNDEVILDKESPIKAADANMIKLSTDNRTVADGKTSLYDVKQGSGAVDAKAKLCEALKGFDIDIDTDINNMIEKTFSTLKGLAESDVKNILYLIAKEIEVTPKNINLLNNNVSGEMKVDKLIDKLLNHLDKSPENNIAQVKEIKNQLNSVFRNIDKIFDKELVELVYKDIIELSEKLDSVLKNNKSDSVEIKTMLMDIKENVEFIKTINEYNNFIHVPILINNHKTSADIYVFSDSKGRKKVDPKNATILISLDLKNIGRIETMINVIEKGVNVVFRANDAFVQQIIKSQVNNLKDALINQGFYLNSSRVINLDESFSLIKLEEMLREDKLKSYNLDVRI